MVHGILLSRFRPAMADDLAQECFITAFSRLDQLKEDGKFGPWIAVIARRMRAPRDLGRIGHRNVDEIRDGAASPEEVMEAERIFRAVANLPEAYRETLMLRLAEGMSGPEIATLTGLTPQSVRVNLHRGMAKLRAALGLTQVGNEAQHD